MLARACATMLASLLLLADAGSTLPATQSACDSEGHIAAPGEDSSLALLPKSGQDLAALLIAQRVPRWVARMARIDTTVRSDRPRISDHPKSPAPPRVHLKRPMPRFVSNDPALSH
jgi:hypothetical protein